ncbi:hypothetical protein NFI96_015418 [Prochilodus magdalenae]|nr:hypothetical protein NFI96_015418 [Prochilodus magdalenae]
MRSNGSFRRCPKKNSNVFFCLFAVSPMMSILGTLSSLQGSMAGVPGWKPVPFVENKEESGRFMTSYATIAQQRGQLSVTRQSLKRARMWVPKPEPQPALHSAVGTSPGKEAEPRAARKMRACVLQCCLALLGLSLVLCGAGASSQPDLDLDLDVDLSPRARRLLQRARALGMASQEWRKREMEDLLSQLTLPESEFQESEITSLGAKQDVRVELERSAENPNSLPPRERKAGCKNFYWKGFTSC